LGVLGLVRCRYSNGKSV